MLGCQEMTCRDCNEYDMAALEMQVSKNGQVQFRVDCKRCGGFSHYLEYSEINRAVRRYMEGQQMADPPQNGLRIRSKE